MGSLFLFLFLSNVLNRKWENYNSYQYRCNLKASIIADICKATRLAQRINYETHTIMKKLLLLSVMLLAFGSLSAQTDRKTTTKKEATSKDQSAMQKDQTDMTTATSPKDRKGTTVKGRKLRKSTTITPADKRNTDGARATTDDRTGTNGMGTTTGTTGTAPSPTGKMPAK